MPGDTTGGQNRLPPAIFVLVAAGVVFSTEMDAGSISSNVSIRIFEKILRIHDFMFNLVEAVENFLKLHSQFALMVGS